MIAQAGEPYRTDLGFVLIDRVGAFINKLSDSERAALVEKLVAAERGPNCADRDKEEANPGTSHEELADTIQEALRQEGAPRATIQTRSDVRYSMPPWLT